MITGMSQFFQCLVGSAHQRLSKIIETMCHVCDIMVVIFWLDIRLTRVEVNAKFVETMNLVKNGYGSDG
jgi:hypothetical protein